MSFKLFGITAVSSMVPAILTWLFIVAFDAIQPTPVAGSSDLATLGTRGGSGLLRGAISGVEIGGKGGEHDQDRPSITKERDVQAENLFPPKRV